MRRKGSRPQSALSMNIVDLELPGSAEFLLDGRIAGVCTRRRVVLHPPGRNNAALEYLGVATSNCS